jgi:hypothetical protein
MVTPEVVPEELSIESSRIVTLVEDPTPYHMYEIPTPQTECFQNVHLYQYRPETILVEVPVGVSFSIDPQSSKSSIGEAMQARLGPPGGAVMLTDQPSEDSRSTEGASNPKRPRGPDRRNARDSLVIANRLTKLGVGPLVREPIRAPYQGDEPYVRNDHVYRTIHHRDRTAREYSEWLIHERTPNFMPILTLSRAQQMIDEKYFVDKTYKPSILEFRENEKPDDDDPRIVAFVNEIKAYGFCSFDTEGAGKLPNGPIHAQRENRLFVSMSCPKTARVVFFHCALDIPESIKMLLADYAIAKIQSGVMGDVELLHQAGLEIRGIVDSGTLFLLLNPDRAEAGFGAKRQMQVLWPGSKVHVP